MLYSSLLAFVIMVQVVSSLPKESLPDLRRALSDEAALGSVEILYSVPDGQLVLLRGNGKVVVQSTKQKLALVPTCEGKVGSADMRRLLQTIVDERFPELPRKLYLMVDADEEDWHDLQLHSIIINTATGAARRDFAAGKYDGKHQNIPDNFARVEKTIQQLVSQAIPKQTRCTVAPLLRFATK